MGKKKTQDLEGMLVLEDEDGGEIATLKGYDDSANTCADLDKKKTCKKAYRREVTDVGRVLLHSCKWKKDAGACIEQDAVDVTSCIDTATKHAEWWAAWGRAILLGTVVVLPVGTVYKMVRRRRQNKHAAPAAPAQPAVELEGRSVIPNAAFSSVV